ncbi:MAG: prepilin-type N-terminal cleavage/methylation domain-containing protein [Candidatus Moraniibacteriota bacterium]|nr:MAG: prepilin-type N-terminal cleavage/methylation domain-containing protein [Candidatus Moranbacteria bacterium]
MQQKKNQKGMTIIEGLLVLAIFSIITLSFYEVYSNGARLALDSKRRLAAVSVANEQFEKLRNLAYTDVGFVDEISTALRGTLPASEREKTVSSAGSSFTVKTIVQNIDDPFDGTAGGSPNDIVPNDSKKVTVKVSWGATDTEAITLTTRFVPDGIETTAGGGNLVVNVSDSSGTSVSSVTVTVTDLDSSNQTQCITESGSCLFVGLDERLTPRYKVSLSKSGYEPVETLDATSTLDPIYKHVSILSGQLQTVSFTMDQSYTIAFSPKEVLSGDTLDTVSYSIAGGRLLGTNPSDGNSPVYSLSPTAVTGEVSLSNAPPGAYFVESSSISPSTYRYWKLDPATVLDAFSVSVGTDGTPNTFTLVAIDDARPGAFFTVTDGTSPVPDASVRFFDALNPSGYDHTSTTDQFGKVYFPHDESETLLLQDYSYEITTTGYQNKSGTVTISDGLVEESVTLIAL